MLQLKVRFSKSKDMRYLSHLDFVRLMYRALRRAKIPFCLTQGFNPRPKAKFSKALKVGATGMMETVFSLKEHIGTDEFKEKMNKQCTEGIEIEELSYDE